MNVSLLPTYQPYEQKAITGSDDGLEQLVPGVPSSGGPDARNNDYDDADDGAGNRQNGWGNARHVIGITPV